MGARRCLSVKSLPSTSSFVSGYSYAGAALSCVAGGYVWVANNTHSSISRVDLKTNTITNYPQTSQGPNSVCSDGSYIYSAGNNSTVGITKLDFNGTKIGSNFVGLGAGLQQIIYDGTSLWVTAYTAGLVHKVSTSGTLLATYTLPTGTLPYAICTEGSNIWVTSANTNYLTKLNSSGTLISSINIGAVQYGVCFDGTYIWTCNPTTLYKLSTSGTILNTYTFGTGNIFMSYSYHLGLLIIPDYNENSVRLVNPATGTIFKTLTVGNSPRNCVEDDFNRLWAASFTDGKLTVIV